MRWHLFGMANFDDGMDVAPGIEVAFDVDFEGVAGGDEVVEDLVDGLFVGDVAIAVTVDVEFDGLQLHHSLVRYVGQINCGKIGITGKRTLAGKFRQDDLDFVATSDPGIGKCHQLPFENLPFTIFHFWGGIGFGKMGCGLGIVHGFDGGGRQIS